MQIFFTVAWFVSVLFSGIASAQMPAGTMTLEDALTYADSAYADISLNIEQRKEIADSMVLAAEKFNDNYDIQWRAAQAIYAYGDLMYYNYQLKNYEYALAKDSIKNTNDVINKSQNLSNEQSKTLLLLGVLGRKYSDRSVELNPDGVQGHYYAAMNIALYAFGKSIVSALIEGLGPRYEKHLDTALKLDEKYQDGTIYAGYGRYWYKLPWPKQSTKKSLENLLSAEKMNTQDILTLDFIGDTYFALNKKQQAAKYWAKVLELPGNKYNSELVKKLSNAKVEFMK